MDYSLRAGVWVERNNKALMKIKPPFNITKIEVITRLKDKKFHIKIN